MNQYLPDLQPSKSCFVRLGLATKGRHLSVIGQWTISPGGWLTTGPRLTPACCAICLDTAWLEALNKSALKAVWTALCQVDDCKR